MHHISDSVLHALIAEDIPYGDLTTRSLNIGALPGRITFAARSPMVACCTEEAARILVMLGCSATVATSSGQAAAADTLLLSGIGRADSLLSAWKVAQTLIEWTSGVATAARAIIDAARHINPVVTVACTRKAVPGTRALSAKAICVAGATLHRCGLSDTILLFPEHRVFGDGAHTLADQITDLRQQNPERSIVVEVKTIADALIARKAGATVLQLEKFSPEEVGRLSAALATCDGPQPVIAAAGGISAANAAAYAAAGARVLVTSSPYTARPADVHVTITAT
ncbi:MAG: ModD protein [Rhodospirillaceae bacterium]|nr:ModD protein [Rhodospirillaceae bacterium]